MTESNGNKPDLIFSPSSTMEGFTSAGVQAFNDLNPAAIVRELIQNSLDAGREVGHKKTTVHFELEKVSLSRVPAIERYHDAVRNAQKYHTEYYKPNPLPDQVKAVLDAINDCRNKNQVEVLSILDNGIGLNEQRMRGLLSDGMTIKPGTSSGAVGNGHLTAIPTSDLRYILYGGVSDGKRIASGHAILATFKQNNRKMGKDGYYAFPLGPDDDQFHFPPGDTIPALIEEKLDQIKTQFDSKSGAAVIIPGFNRFREENGLWDIIREAAACSFFVAIADDDLEITYKDYIEGKEKKLNKSNIQKLFEEGLASKQRSKTRGFPSGKLAAEAYKTAAEIREEIVDIGCGKVDIRIREVASGLSSRIGLCRNGMWITDQLPGLHKNKFRDHKPFNCLIKVTSQDGDIHRLIRKSEGPLHNSIEASKWLNKDENALFYKAFDQIAEFLKGELEISDSNSFRIRGILSVRSAKGIEGGFYANSFEEIPPPRIRTLPDGPETRDKDDLDIVSEHKGNAGGGGGTKTVSASKGNSINFHAVPVPTGLRSCIFELHPDKKLSANSRAVICFVLDENIDDTCDVTSKGKEQRVKLKAVKLNGKPVLERNLIRDSNGDIDQVSLDQFQAVVKLSFDYDLPNDVDVQATDKVVLSAKMVSRRNQS